MNYVIRITNTDSLETTEHISTGTSISVTGLQPFTTFICVVAAATSLGTGPFSHLYFIQTPEAGMLYIQQLLESRAAKFLISAFYTV